jgi:hypothetical protein
MRVATFGVIIAFLIASTHIVVDHGGGPRDFVLIPHMTTLAVHADDLERELPSSQAPSHHDTGVHTHVEWYTTASVSDSPYQPINSVMVASEGCLTTEVFVASPRFRVIAFMPPPPCVPLYLRCCALLS